jgi:hypothetical protein
MTLIIRHLLSFGDNSIFLFRITKPALPTATVCINCQELDRVVWTPPYQITLLRDLRANGNQLEIRVATPGGTDCWPTRFCRKKSG